CTPLDGVINSKISPIEKDQIEVSTIQKPEEIVPTPQTPPDNFKIYFANDNVEIPTDYENGDGSGVGNTDPSPGYITAALNDGSLHSYPDESDYALNGGTFDGKSGQPLSIPNSGSYNGWQG